MSAEGRLPVVDLKIELTTRAEAGHQVRQLLRERVGERLSGPGVDDLITLVTELVNNAVEHGPGGPIDVRVIVEDDGVVRGMVEDHGNGGVAIREPADPAAEGGRGLRIVDAIASRWGVYPNSTTVWFEIPAPAVGG